MSEYFRAERARQPEGVAFDVQITKSANAVFDLYEGGLRSSLTYLGAEDIDEYRKNAVFFTASQAYMQESNSRPQ
jgi:IMP dehydrogenase/GMP reductase